MAEKGISTQANDACSFFSAHYAETVSLQQPGWSQMRAGNITGVEAGWRWSPADEEEIVSSVCTHITRRWPSHAYTDRDVHMCMSSLSKHTYLPTHQLSELQPQAPVLSHIPAIYSIYMAQLYDTTYSHTHTEDMLCSLFLSLPHSDTNGHTQWRKVTKYI